MDKENYMKRCYELAVQAGKKGFDTFGAVLVHDGKILEKTQRTGKRVSSATQSSTWFINARTVIQMQS